MKDLTNNALQLLKQRYFHENEDWIGMVNRVVNHVCVDENDNYKTQVTGDLLNRVWLPNSPCLVNSGKDNAGLMACFVVGPTEDTLENHFETLSDIASIAKHGGGCGFTGSNIRHHNAAVAGSTHGYAYGPNNYAKMVSHAMDMMTQSGFRKMALMYSLDCNHIDIEDFITLKGDGAHLELYNFNQSVVVNDDWLTRAFEENESKESVLLQLIAQQAWEHGCPGLLFDDTINQTGMPYYDAGEIIQVSNPCGEVPMPAHLSCNLGSINLAHNVFYDEYGTFDFDVLTQVVNRITRFLDNVGTVNHFPTDKLSEKYEQFRPIGVGVMGVADALLRMQLRYGEQPSLNWLSSVMRHIQTISYKMSEQLGEERGVPEKCQNVNRRNLVVQSVAPTGSIAMIAGCSHGIEPIFSPSYTRVDEKGTTYTVDHVLKDESYFASCIGHNNTPTWEQHLSILSTTQKYVDQGVSKTINLPNSATVHDVIEVFRYAWKSGVKGITIYRDGSRDVQVLTDNVEVTKETELLANCPTGVCAL